MDEDYQVILGFLSNVNDEYKRKSLAKPPYHSNELKCKQVIQKYILRHHHYHFHFSRFNIFFCRPHFNLLICETAKKNQQKIHQKTWCLIHLIKTSPCRLSMTCLRHSFLVICTINASDLQVEIAHAISLYNQAHNESNYSSQCGAR